MAGRKAGYRHTQATRDKIQATQLINRLYSGAMGEVELTPAQVNAAKTLLNKVLPDLSSVEVEADVDAKVSGKVEWVVDATGNDSAATNPSQQA